MIYTRWLGVNMINITRQELVYNIIQIKFMTEGIIGDKAWEEAELGIFEKVSDVIDNIRFSIILEAGT